MLSAASASFARWDVAWHLAACAQYLVLPVNAGICVNVKKFLVGLVFFFVSNFRELCPKATQRLIPYSTRIFFSLPNKNQYSWNVDGRNLFCSLSDVNGKKGEGGGTIACWYRGSICSVHYSNKSGDSCKISVLREIIGDLCDFNWFYFNALREVHLSTWSLEWQTKQDQYGYAKKTVTSLHVYNIRCLEPVALLSTILMVEKVICIKSIICTRRKAPSETLNAKSGITPLHSGLQLLCSTY